MNFHHFNNFIITSECNMGLIYHSRVNNPLSKICAMDNFEPACVCFLKKDVRDNLMTVFNSGIEYIYTDCFFDQLFDYSRHFPVPQAESYMLQVLKNCPGVQEEGIFCDIAGTLIQENGINKVLVDKLREKEERGYEITLWTGGSIDNKLRTELQSADITWPVVKKYDYRGKRVAEAYDDEDKDILYRKYGISITELTIV